MDTSSVDISDLPPPLPPEPAPIVMELRGMASQPAPTVRNATAAKTAAVDISDLPPPIPPPDPSAGGGTLRFGPWDTGVPIGESTTRFLAGAGKAGYDLARGAGQWLGLESREDVAASRKLDAPLMATTAGKVGDIAGNIAFAAPATLIPGANAPIAAAAIGATTGALQPSTSTKETVENIGFGGGAGAAGSVIGQKIGNVIAGKIAARQAASQSETALNAERDATLAEARSAGYVVPPTSVNPTLATTALESVSGKAATRQAATATNQKATNSLVRQDLGLPKDAPITQKALDSVRAQAGTVYNSVKSAGRVASDQQYSNDLQTALTGSPQLQQAYPGIGGQADQRLQDLVKTVSVPEHDAADIVEAVKYLRNQSKGNFKSAFTSGDPDTMALARGQQAVGDSMEDLLKRHLQASGQGDLADAWDAARTTIAKAHSAEAALKGNNVSAAHLALQAKRGKPMSGGMDLAAKFGTHFGDVAGIPHGGAGVSKLAATIAGAGELSALYLQSPQLAIGSAALAAAPYMTRAGILSRPGQALLTTPGYGPGAVGTASLKTLEAIGRRGQLAGALPMSQILPGRQ